MSAAYLNIIYCVQNRQNTRRTAHAIENWNSSKSHIPNVARPLEISVASVFLNKMVCPASFPQKLLRPSSARVRSQGWPRSPPSPAAAYCFNTGITNWHRITHTPHHHVDPTRLSDPHRVPSLWAICFVLEICGNYYYYMYCTTTTNDNLRDLPSGS